VKQTYYVCVATHSKQGCDAILTVALARVSDHRQDPIWLKASYPSIWPIGDGGAAPSSLTFLVKADVVDDPVQVSAVPVSGASTLKVFGTQDCGGKPLSSSNLDGPDIVDVPYRDLICINVTGTGVVALTAGSRSSGAFITPAVQTEGRLKGSKCKVMRLKVKEQTGMTVTATSVDGSELTVTAALERQKLANLWRGVSPPGGEGAVLVVKAAEIMKASLAAGMQGDVCLSVKVCLDSHAQSSDESKLGVPFWLTAVTDSEVSQLEDGIPFGTSMPSTQKLHGKAVPMWREFRYLVPGGAAKPKEIVIRGSTSGQAFLVADTKRIPFDPRSFRWTSGRNSSLPVIRLTTDPELASREVHLVDCRPPCFVYTAAHAFTPGHHDMDTDLQITVGSDQASVKPLLENQPLQLTLAGREAHIFRYSLADKISPAIFSVSCSEGAVEFSASAVSSFPVDSELTTPTAEDVILLEDYSDVYKTATRKAASGMAPALYVRVRTTSESPSTFTIVGRKLGDANVLRNAEETRGAVDSQGYDRYRFFVSDVEAKQPVEVSVSLQVLAGKPEVFVACEPNLFPHRHNYNWGGQIDGEGVIEFTTSSTHFRPGWVYIGVASTHSSAFSLRVKWGNSTLRLQDGMEEIGTLTAKESYAYFLYVTSNQIIYRSVLLRAEALVGAIEVCVHAVDTGVPNGASCMFATSAKASGPPEQALAALDLPAESVHDGGKFKIIVTGVSTTNNFVLRAVVNAPVTLAKGRNLVLDSFGPPCCTTGPLFTQRLTRRYMTYLKSNSPGTLVLKALGDATLSGAIVKAGRHHGATDQMITSRWPLIVKLADEKKYGTFRLPLDPIKLAETDSGNCGFWLEVKVEFPHPVNVTFAI